MVEFNESETSIAGFLKTDPEKLEAFKSGTLEGLPFLQAVKTVLTTDFLNESEKYVMMFDLGSNLAHSRMRYEQQVVMDALQDSPVL